MTDTLQVLLVEDESLVRMMLNDIVCDLGHEVAAQSGKLEPALKLAAEAGYDLAILDINLGDTLSYPVADIVRKRGKALVLATGYGATGVREDYRDTALVQKPFSHGRLADAIRVALATHGSLDNVR